MIVERRGKPGSIVSDNGTEFTCNAMLAWCKDTGIDWHFASSDPNLGYWTYAYNTLGQMVSQTDAKSQTTTLTYDKLNRLTQRVEVDGTSVWTYDTAANGIGKLASSGITAGVGIGFGRSVSYDTLGRPMQVSTTIDGSTYVMGAAYATATTVSALPTSCPMTPPARFTGLQTRWMLRDI
jgi:YD repeat-containing protein